VTQAPQSLVFPKLHPGTVSVSLKCDPSLPISCVSQASPRPSRRVSQMRPKPTNLLCFSSFTQAQSLCLLNVTQAPQSLVFLKLYPGPFSVSLKCDPSLPISCVSQASPRPSRCVSQMRPKPTNLLCFSSFTQGQSPCLSNVTKTQLTVSLQLNFSPVAYVSPTPL
jgi:hypothetical protein